MHTTGLTIPNLLMREQVQGLNKLTVVAHPLKGRARGHLTEDGEGCWERALMGPRLGVAGATYSSVLRSSEAAPFSCWVQLARVLPHLPRPAVSGSRGQGLQETCPSCRAAAPTTKESLRNEGSGRQIEAVRPVPSEGDSSRLVHRT